MDFNFKKTIVSEEVNNKLVIKRLPEWMQKSVQIQKFFDDAIQPWFNTEQHETVDGYIGDRGTPAALGKVFVSENDLERTAYQLSTAYVCENTDDNIVSMQFYPDLINSLAHNGAITTDHQRLLSGPYYSWEPPINKNKMINYSNYFWDTENEWGLTTPDYVVMQRGADNGNLWSVQNYWYTIGDTLSDGTVVEYETIGTSRFKQAQMPIIEYNKNIEMMDSGTQYRTTVDFLEDTYTPEDMMLKRVGDGAKSDGELIYPGARILFTSVGNPGENNRIYVVNGSKMANGSIQLGLVLDPDELTASRPTGEPHVGDVIIVKSGKTNGGTTVFWTGTEWKKTTTKTDINTAPKFVLYDLDGVRLDDPIKYPGSNFTGNSIFYFKIDYDYDYDVNYTNQVAKNVHQYPVFDNSISTVVYQYMVDGEYVDIDSIYQYNILMDVGISTESEIYFRAYSPNHDEGLTLYGTTPSSIGKNFTIKVSNNSYIKNLYPNGTKNDNYLSYGQDGIWKYDINDQKLKIGTEVQTEYTSYDITVAANVSGEKLTAVGKLYKVRMPKVVIEIPSIAPVVMDDWNQIYIPDYDVNDYVSGTEYNKFWSGRGEPNTIYTVYMDLEPVNGLNQKTETETYTLGEITVDADGYWLFEPDAVMITDPNNDSYSSISYLSYYFYRANVRFVHSSGVSSTKRIYSVYPDFYPTTLSSTIPTGLVTEYQMGSFTSINNKGTVLYDAATNIGYISLNIGQPTVGWSTIEYAPVNNESVDPYCTLTAVLDGTTIAEYTSPDLIYDRVFTVPDMLVGDGIDIIKSFTFTAVEDGVVLTATAKNYNTVDYGEINSHYAGITLNNIKMSSNENINIFVNATKSNTTNVSIPSTMVADAVANAYTISWIDSSELNAGKTKMFVGLRDVTDQTFYTSTNVSSATASANTPIATYNAAEYLNARWFGSGLNTSVLPYPAIETTYGSMYGITELPKRLHGNLSLSQTINNTAKNMEMIGTYIQYYATRTNDPSFNNTICVTVINDTLGTLSIAKASANYDLTKSVSRGGSFTLLLNQETHTVSAIGYNTYGALNVTGWTNIAEVAAGAEHSVGRTLSGTAVAIGRQTSWGNLAVTGWTNITSIAAGSHHTIGCKADGTVLSVGPSTGATTYLNTASWTGISKVYAGGDCSIGLKTNGTVVAAHASGGNFTGWNFTTWTNIKKIATGTNYVYHVLGLKTDGTVIATGNTGGSAASALLVTGWTDIVDIACTAKASFGLKSDGTVVIAGDPTYFTTFQTWTDIKAIFGNNYGIIGIKSDGTMVSDGNNANGDLTVAGIDLVP